MTAGVSSISNQPAPHLIRALLPWENEADFADVAQSWHAAYAPQGPAEQALVNQLVWIDWRRRRIVLGERALHMNQLYSRSSGSSSYGTCDGLVSRALIYKEQRLRKFSSREAIATSKQDDASLLAYSTEALQQVMQAKALLMNGCKDTLSEAAALLQADSLEWWADEREDAPDRYAETVDGLLNFLKTKLIPWFEGLEKQAGERDAVRLQAQGESLDPKRMAFLHGLDERLGRQFEKTLGMLIKLQEIRGTGLNIRE